MTFIGSDDMLLDGALRDAACRWQSALDCGAIVGAFVYMDEHSRIEGYARSAEIGVPTPSDFSTGVAYRLHQVSTIYSRAALETVGPHVLEDLRYTMDRELLFRVARAFTIITSPLAYGAFRLHSASKTGAEVLALYREFARLPLLFLDENIAANRLRRRQSRSILAHGYLRYSQGRSSRLSAAMALLNAFVRAPGIALRPGYIAAWFDVFGIREAMRLVRHRFIQR